MAPQNAALGTLFPWQRKLCPWGSPSSWEMFLELRPPDLLPARAPLTTTFRLPCLPCPSGGRKAAPDSKPHILRKVGKAQKDHSFPALKVWGPFQDPQPLSTFTRVLGHSSWSSWEGARVKTDILSLCRPVLLANQGPQTQLVIKCIFLVTEDADRDCIGLSDNLGCEIPFQIFAHFVCMVVCLTDF